MIVPRQKKGRASLVINVIINMYAKFDPNYLDYHVVQEL